MVNSYWKQYQKTLANLPSPRQEPLQRDSNRDEDDYKRIKYTSARPQANAFTLYCTEDTIEDFKLSDWKMIEKKRPQLVQFALNHALPISISDCERSFSSAKFTLNPLQTCMKSDLFEALETLRAWYLQKQQDSNREKEAVEWEEELAVISQALQDSDLLECH